MAVITGTSSGETLQGTEQDDTINGGGGVDTLVGRGGNDILITDGDDIIVEDATGGRDQVLASANYVLNAGAYAELLSTTSNVGTANINLTGNAFAQAVIGNAGNNVLDGGGGRDALVGLGGLDAFAFTTALGSDNVAQIIDFTVGEDRIVLENAVFTGLGLGDLAAAAFRSGTSAQDTDDRIIYDPTTGALFFDADGNGAGAAVQFATLSTNLNLSASDFAVI